MKIAYYYHISVKVDRDGRISVPAFIGLFLDELASHVKHLILVVHTVDDDVNVQNDYIVRSTNVSVKSLGVKRAAYIRFFFSGLFIRKVVDELTDVDYLIIRSPSPLAPAFSRFFPASKLVYMVVGSYGEGLKHLKQPWYRLWIIKWLNRQMHRSLEKAVLSKRIIVNSQVLLDTYAPLGKEVKLIYTTTITSKDFYLPQRQRNFDQIGLLYVGRIDLAKGIKECVLAVAELKRRGRQSTLEIVGWEEGGASITTYLNSLSTELGIKDSVVFVGKKKAGEELLEYYRHADIYILPSYHEGFPRTIWEAMASSLPVVATKVGSIPHFVKDQQEAMLVSPGNVDELVDAVEKIVTNEELRLNLIWNGLARARNVTLENQTAVLVKFLKDE